MEENVRYVESWGELFCMTEKRYQAFLEEGTKGGEPIPETYGNKIGEVEKVTDWEKADYESALKQFLEP
jgi:hypothetical protein